MLTLPPDTRIFIALAPIDMRRSFDGLCAAVVDVLSQLGVKFHGVNILVDPELREGIKEFSQWPTIPQLYVKGEFIGGCDIVREMFETGELETVLKEKGVALAAAA